MRHLPGFITRVAGSAGLAGLAGTIRAALVAMAFVAVALPALMPLVANPRSGPREIVLVARDMAFYLEGSKEPNPTIVLKRSEEVRFVVKNQDAGITHALSIASLDVSIDRIAPGSTEKTKFRAPRTAGRFDYVCPPHAQMMRGQLVIED